MKRVFSGIAASLFAAVFCLAGCTADPAREPVQEPMQPGGPVAEVPADPPDGEEDGLQVILVQSPMGEAEIVEETSNYIRYRAEANEGVRPAAVGDHDRFEVGRTALSLAVFSSGYDREIFR